MEANTQLGTRTAAGTQDSSWRLARASSGGSQAEPQNGAETGRAGSRQRRAGILALTPSRLKALEQVVLNFSKPQTLIYETGTMPDSQSCQSTKRTERWLQDSSVPDG